MQTPHAPTLPPDTASSAHLARLMIVDDATDLMTTVQKMRAETGYEAVKSRPVSPPAPYVFQLEAQQGTQATSEETTMALHTRSRLSLRTMQQGGTRQNG